MNKELALANKIMKEANDYTGWGFSVVPQDNIYLVGTSLQRKEGQVLNIVFEVRADIVTINTILPECKYSERKAKEILETLEFPIEAKGISGEMLMAVCHIPTGIVESDTDIVVESMMVSMVDAMTKIVKKDRCFFK